MNTRAPDTLERPEGWLRTGAPTPCTTNPDLWFSTEPDEQRAAARACMDCPLLQACAQYARDRGEKWGVWGGLTEKARRPKRRTVSKPKKKKPLTPVVCGTSAAYWRHRNNREQCEACLAWRAREVEADRRRRLANEHAKGGSRTGYQLHQRLGERPCGACREANKVVCADQRVKRMARRAVAA